MIRAVAYIDNEWAFGAIHYGLSRYIFQHGVDLQVLSWAVRYSVQEMRELDRKVAIYLTTPQGYQVLVRDYSVAADKIIVVAHAVTDLHQLTTSADQSRIDHAKQFAVTSEFLRRKAAELEIGRVPSLVPMGVDEHWFEGEPARRLETVGYAGVLQRIDGHATHDIKRGHLVEHCVKEAGLSFSVATNYHNSFVTMAGYYSQVDCVIIASTEEGAGLPALEAGAAGRLVISTPVGHWPERIGSSGGHEVPINEHEFIAETTRLLGFYKQNAAEFQKKCYEIQQHARSYSWDNCIEPWVKLLTV